MLGLIICRYLRLVMALSPSVLFVCIERQRTCSVKAARDRLKVGMGHDRRRSSPATTHA